MKRAPQEAPYGHGFGEGESFLWGFPNTPPSCLFLLSHCLPPGLEPASYLPQVTGAPGAQSPTVPPRCYQGPGLLLRETARARVAAQG